MAFFLEAFMSKPSSTSGQPIPLGILVTKSGPSNKSAPKRKSESAANQLPWLWIATGGCAVWIVVVLVIAATSLSREPEQPVRHNPAALAKFGIVEPAFQGVKPAVVEAELPDEPVALPNVAAPKLPLRGAPIEAIDEAPPLKLAKLPGGVAGADVAAIDHRLFADCEQIGAKVLFMRDPPDAFKRARAENKMVFIVHLSGNLEDKEFT